MFGSRLVKFILALLALGSVVVAYVLAPTSGREYAFNRATMQAALARIEIPPVFTDPSQKLKLVESRDTHVTWDLSSGSGPSIRILAQIDAVSPDATKATIVVTQPELGKTGPNIFVKAAIKKVFEAAFREQIAAQVERRQFESYRLAPELALMMVIAITSM